ncbi:MAG: F0F1 ATP synthase subunit B [Planctomycetia bacterium]|nr:F0F1 ATP synthase subunit B [Planctomycetia bacterium]
MKLARLVLCLVIACGIGSLRPVGAYGEDVEAKIAHAESELAKAADTDSGQPTTSADPLSIDPDLAIWTAVVFVVLLVVLKKFAWGPIIQSLETREQTIANHIAEAQRNHEEAKRLLAQYERKLAQAANEVRELMEEARRDAEHAKQAILAEGKAGAEAERARALHDIEAAADQAMESLAERSAQLAIDLAGKILQARLSKEDHTRLIQEAMAKFPATSAN